MDTANGALQQLKVAEKLFKPRDGGSRRIGVVLWRGTNAAK